MFYKKKKRIKYVQPKKKNVNIKITDLNVFDITCVFARSNTSLI